MDNIKLRPIKINLDRLEESNFFGDDENALQRWCEGMGRLASRDDVDIAFSWIGTVGAVPTIAVKGLGWDEYLYDTPEFEWFDKASDEAWNAEGTLVSAHA